MNELLQKHGCSNVFAIPEGLKELMSDITREVLRNQPKKIFDFIANYLSVLLITREHGILAVKLLEDLCDCRPSVSDHLLQLGLENEEAGVLAQIIKEEVEHFEPEEGKETVKETEIVKKILKKMPLDEEMTAKVCQVARNAYRDYWYKKKLMQKEIKSDPEEPWEIAAHHTIELYKRTKPSFDELSRATQKIQAAYRGYHVRRNLLRHLKPKKKPGPKVDLSGPPLDIDGSRDIDLGPIINLKVRDDQVHKMFETKDENLVLNCDSIKAITHVEDEEDEVTSRVGRKIMTVGRQVDDKTEYMTKESDKMDFASQKPAVQVPISLPMRKISFAEVPETVDDHKDGGPLHIPEEIREDDTNKKDAENIQDIPEDIPDDAESAPTASVASSAPETPNVTDAEDVDEYTSEDEG